MTNLHPLADMIPDLADRINAIQHRRIETGCIAADGSSHRTPEKATWWNDMISWHERGKPEDERKALVERERDLRRRRLF